ncbi:phosphatidylserine decarboxylase [Aspergillus stella-maris]|uniref:phosphatidylserine decarboxylase n=1 Tax=Aspergillus stella-maris TaxID=1810926 RepID=UPI003CCE1FEE
MDSFETDIKADTVLTIKERKYTLAELFGNDGSEKPFVGGSFYQGSSPRFGYHRWHAPISGTITKSVKIPGRVGSLQMGQGSEGTAIEPTRALIGIQGRAGSKIGSIGCVFSGLMPKNAVEITVKQGEEVKKGQEIGMFHFGGSNYVVVFQQSANVGSGQVNSGQVPVRSALVTI